MMKKCVLQNWKQRPKLIERDEEELWQTSELLEFYTKTEQIRERDDDDVEMKQIFEMQFCRELVSKTFADRESDDEDDIIPPPQQQMYREPTECMV